MGKAAHSRVMQHILGLGWAELGWAELGWVGLGWAGQGALGRVAWQWGRAARHLAGQGTVI